MSSRIVSFGSVFGRVRSPAYRENSIRIVLPVSRFRFLYHFRNFGECFVWKKCAERFESWHILGGVLVCFCESRETGRFCANDTKNNWNMTMCFGVESHTSGRKTREELDACRRRRQQVQWELYFWMCASYIRSFALFSRAAMRGCENTTKRPDRDMRNWVKRGKKQNVIYVPHSRTCRTGPHNLSPPVQWAAEHVEWVLLPLYWSGIPIARKHHQNSAVLKPKITVSIRGEWGKRTDRGGSGVEYSSLETN